ncbi:MAG TPA: isochorismatase family cysteine hydrolase [Methylomirabilota bacterium]|nr:isochorismatase family cysteine hydrolase [Methylomirabilota bacterium]
MSARAPTRNLHGGAPGRSPVVLLVIDAINDFDFEEGKEVLADAYPVAQRIRRLKQAARRAGVATVYVNDNFGRWRSDFRTLVAHCLRATARGRAVTRLLRPDQRDYFVLKPSHSAFYSTTLELLLQHLDARTLILTGLLADSCILLTAQEAHMRGYHVVVPADCVAARLPEDRRRALAQMRRALRADTRPSAALDVKALRRGAGRDGRDGHR